MTEAYLFSPQPIRITDQLNGIDITFEGRTNRRIMETADEAGVNCAIPPIGQLVKGVAFINGHTYYPGELVPLSQAYPATPLCINLLPLPKCCDWEGFFD